MVLGTVLDGIPEGIVLGMSFIGGGGGSVAMIAAVFTSNLPEAVGSTQELEKSYGKGQLLRRVGRYRRGHGVAVAVGFALFDTASDGVVAFTQSFAAGALLTMVAGTMLPRRRMRSPGS